MVQRYEFKDVCANPYLSYYEMVESDEGDWVSYEDYKELETAVIALLVDINRRYPGEGFKCPLILKLAEIVEHEPRN